MEPLYRNITNIDWITVVILGSLALLTVGKYLFKNAFFNFLQLPFNAKYLSWNKKKGRLIQGFHILLVLFQLINYALLFFIARSFIRYGTLDTSYEIFLALILGLLVFLLLKVGLQMGTGYFFENMELMGDLIFEKLTYFNYGSLLAFGGNILLIYVFPGSISLVYAIVFMVLAMNCIGLVKILRNYQKLIIGNAFYFILYLCTLEISPIAIIISYLNS